MTHFPVTALRSVELETPDGVLHARDPQMQPLEMDVQPVECQEPVRVGRDVHLQVVDDLGRNPPSAQLQPREVLFVEHQDIDTPLLQMPRGRRPSRPAADYQNVTSSHDAYRA